MQELIAELGIGASIIFTIWKTTQSNKREIKKLDHKLTEHNKFDLKDKVKERFHYFKRIQSEGGKIHVLEVRDAMEIVNAARAYKVNGETTHMQNFIECLYNEKLKYDGGEKICNS